MSKNAVILAGGLGSRLKPFTDIIPKPLLPVGERAVLEIQVDQLSRHGFTDVYLATNHKAGYIERFVSNSPSFNDVRVHMSREEKPLGTAGPMRLLKDQLGSDPFLVMNGDILTTLDFGDFLDFASRQDSLLTVGIKKQVYPFQFGNVLFEGDYVTSVEEKPQLVTYILAGIYVMKPAALDLIPENEYFGIDDLMTTMIDRHYPITKYEINEYWLDIGRQEDYERAQEDYAAVF